MEERIPRRSQPDCGRHEMHRDVAEHCATKHVVDASLETVLRCFGGFVGGGGGGAEED